MNIKTGRVCDYNPEHIQGGILGDSMGLGKTLSMISLMATDWPKDIIAESEMRTTLLIVPSSLLATWEHELEKHLCPGTFRFWKYYGPRRSHDIPRMLARSIVLTSHDTVAREWRQLQQGPKPLYSHIWHRIVLDEGKSEHRIRE